jgi:Acetyltransferases
MFSLRKAVIADAESLERLIDDSVRGLSPGYTDSGIGRALLTRCEAEARAHGFGSTELVATLAGRELYRACGYVADEPFEHRLTENVAIQFIAMRKRLDDRCVGTPAPPTAR